MNDVDSYKPEGNKIRIASQEVENALHDLNKIINSSLDIFCTINKEGRFMHVSSASQNLWGYIPAELKGRKYISLVYDDDAKRTIKVAERIMSGKSVSIFENRYVHKDGSIVPMLWSARWDDKDKLIYCVAKDATEKKRLEKAFQSERRRFYDMFLQAPSSLGILKGPYHIFEKANTLFLQLTGRKDIIGKTLPEVFPELKDQGLFELVDQVYTTGIPVTENERLIKIDKYGSGKLIDVYLNFVFQAYRNNENKIDGIFFFAIDVTEQVQSRKKLEESEKRFRQIAETAQEGIWMIDENNKTVFVNQKICDILGYSRQEMLEASPMSFKEKNQDQITLNLLEIKKQEVNKTYETKYIARGGRPIWTTVSTNPLYSEDEVYRGSLSMITDITIRKEQEIQIRKNIEEREILIAELTKSIKDLKQFTYITSHNFKGPLSNLTGLLSLVDFSTLSDVNKDIVEMFKASTLQLNKTIDDLVQILIIKNNVNVSLSNNNINQLLKEVCASLRHEMEETGCTINEDFQVENIYFNKSYIENILLNLLSNAVKYHSPNRPLCIDLSTERKPNDEVLMSIKDNGIGIDLIQNRDRIFGLYQRFHSNPDGVGLGLFIVKSQIGALGGRIEVESEVDKGTTFYITFKEKRV